MTDFPIVNFHLSYSVVTVLFSLLIEYTIFIPIHTLIQSVLLMELFFFYTRILLFYKLLDHGYEKLVAGIWLRLSASLNGFGNDDFMVSVIKGGVDNPC